MKIYTRTGDQGKSSLFSGERVAKSHQRIKTYGEVDELNAVIGSLIAALPAAWATPAAELQQIQGELFEIGAWLATLPGSPVALRLTPFGDTATLRLESQIDRLQERLPPLRRFILPGGHPAAAWAHLARTVCRRVERTVIDLTAVEGAFETAAAGILSYLNRLSDYLFVVARFCNQAAGVSDVEWQAPPKP